MRKFRIWYYGRLPLAKKIRKRIIIDMLYEHVKDREHPSTINPLIFQDAMNRSQYNLFESLSQKQKEKSSTL